jgi:hypothetical protein
MFQGDLPTNQGQASDLRRPAGALWKNKAAPITDTAFKKGGSIAFYEKKTKNTGRCKTQKGCRKKAEILGQR